jgi:hypothetical protein
MPFQGLPQIEVIAKFLLIVCNDAKGVIESRVKTCQGHHVGVEATIT